MMYCHFENSGGFPQFLVEHSHPLILYWIENKGLWPQFSVCLLGYIIWILGTGPTELSFPALVSHREKIYSFPPILIYFKNKGRAPVLYRNIRESTRIYFYLFRYFAISYKFKYSFILTQNFPNFGSLGKVLG